MKVARRGGLRRLRAVMSRCHQSDTICVQHKLGQLEVCVNAYIHICIYIYIISLSLSLSLSLPLCIPLSLLRPSLPTSLTAGRQADKHTIRHSSDETRRQPSNQNNKPTCQKNYQTKEPRTIKTMTTHTHTTNTIYPTSQANEQRNQQTVQTHDIV